MAARSTGIFPREGFNLDNAFKLIHNGLVTAPVNLKHCRTLRVVCVGYEITGDSIVAIDIGGSNVMLNHTVLDQTLDGVKVFHVRGHNLVNSECIVTPFVNTGTITVGEIYVELVDGPAR